MAQTTLVIIPTYNERDNIEPLVQRIFATTQDIEILIVDDSSVDGTGQIADALAHRDRRIHVLHRPAKLGMGTAYVDGFRWALHHGFSQAAQMDADGSHDPAELQGLIERLETSDLVIGSRVIDGGSVVGWGPLRTGLSRSGSLYCKLFLGWDLTDPTSGFRAHGPRSLKTITSGPMYSEGFSFQLETAYRVKQRGFEIVEYPIRFIDRSKGASKLSSEIIIEALLMIPLLRIACILGVIGSDGDVDSQ